MFRLTFILLPIFIFSNLIYSQEVNSEKTKTNNIQGTENIDAPQTTGDKVEIKNSSGNAIITITDEGSDVGSITLPSGSIPTTPANKLYNVGGELQFNGSTLGTTSSGGGWVRTGTNVTLGTLTDNVGIGTSSPTSNLDIRSSATNIRSRFRISNSDGSHNIFLSSGSSEANPYISFREGDSLNFRSFNAGSSTELMTITDDGNVGIGTSNPLSKLSVAGGPLNGINVETSGYIAISGYASAKGNIQNRGGLFMALGDNGNGVYGAGQYGGYFEGIGRTCYGVYGSAGGAEGYGVYGVNYYSGNVTNYGGYFESGGGTGVVGKATNTGSGINYGGHFSSGSESGVGIYGEASGINGSGVYGYASNAGDVRNYGGYFKADGSNGYGVYGLAYGSNAIGVFGGSNVNSGYGVYGSGYRGGYFTGIYGVYGYSAGGYAVYGYSSDGRAGFFNGNVEISNGLLTANQSLRSYGSIVPGGSYGLAGYFLGDIQSTQKITCQWLVAQSKSFKIDHPLDPQNKYLSHSCVESPDMMNIYNGIIKLDNNGEAIVKLPDYFEALNMEFRYQLTAVGAPGPGLYIAEEIFDNQFSIRGGDPGMKVSWQVTGIRHDAAANKNRVLVEEWKDGAAIGKYLNPEAFDFPKSMGEDYVKENVSAREKMESDLIKMDEQVKIDEAIFKQKTN